VERQGSAFDTQPRAHVVLYDALVFTLTLNRIGFAWTFSLYH